MTRLVSPDRIESLVGRARHATAHYARAVTADDVVVILHSQACLDAHRSLGRDLTQCSFSRALDKGVVEASWRGREDRPQRVAIQGGRLARVPDPESPLEVFNETLKVTAHAIRTIKSPVVRDAAEHADHEHTSVYDDGGPLLPGARMVTRPRNAPPEPLAPAPRRSLGRCDSCDMPIRPTGECACSD